MTIVAKGLWKMIHPLDLVSEISCNKTKNHLFQLISCACVACVRLARECVPDCVRECGTVRVGKGGVLIKVSPHKTIAP